MGWRIYGYLLKIQHRALFSYNEKGDFNAFFINLFASRLNLEEAGECVIEKMSLMVIAMFQARSFLLPQTFSSRLYFLFERLANALNWNRIFLNWKFKSYKEYMFADE